MSREPAKCGTISGYAKHLRRGEATCADCKAAQAAWHLEYRKRSPKTRENRKAYGREYQRAYRRLIELHREEFEALLAEERAK